MAKEELKESCTFDLEKSICAEVDSIAHSEDRSFAAQLRVIIKEWLEDYAMKARRKTDK